MVNKDEYIIGLRGLRDDNDYRIDILNSISTDKVDC